MSDGWRLDGNLKTLGYFAANVCLGADHKTFSLIVDTGSSLAAMPCADCSGCGKHQTGARFDPSRPGATTVDCNHPPTSMRCNGCGSGHKCGYSVSYTEGSSISGYMVQDKLHLSSGEGEKAIDATFGCQTRETGLFHSQMADGIVGFSNSAQYGPTFMDRLVSGLRAPNVFSMCLSEEVGAMVMGGAIPNDLEASWISTSRISKSYAVTITDFKVAGDSVGGGSSQYHEAIVDSGTTFTYLPPTAYSRARDHFRNHCAPWAGGGRRWGGGRSCALGEAVEEGCGGVGVWRGGGSRGAPPAYAKRTYANLVRLSCGSHVDRVRAAQVHGAAVRSARPRASTLTTTATR